MRTPPLSSSSSITFLYSPSLPPLIHHTLVTSTSSYPFCNLSLPIVSRLALNEKISQLFNTAPPISRLGIPSYQWWSEALHGVANVGKGIWLNGTIHSATSFPRLILLILFYDYLGFEARAVFNVGQAEGMTFCCTMFLGPGVDTWLSRLIVKSIGNMTLHQCKTPKTTIWEPQMEALYAQAEGEPTKTNPEGKGATCT